MGLSGPRSMMAASGSLLIVMMLGSWAQASPSTCTRVLDNRSMEICKTHPHKGKPKSRGRFLIIRKSSS